MWWKRSKHVWATVPWALFGPGHGSGLMQGIQSELQWAGGNLNHCNSCDHPVVGSVWSRIHHYTSCEARAKPGQRAEKERKRERWVGEKKKRLEGRTLDSGCQHIEVKHKGAWVTCHVTFPTVLFRPSVHGLWHVTLSVHWQRCSLSWMTCDTLKKCSFGQVFTHFLRDNYSRRKKNFWGFFGQCSQPAMTCDNVLKCSVHEALWPVTWTLGRNSTVIQSRCSTAFGRSSLRARPDIIGLSSGFSSGEMVTCQQCQRTLTNIM